MFSLFTKKKYADIDAADFAKAMEQPNTLVVDVRTPAEFKSGHIPGARNIDLMGGRFAEQISQLDKDKTYLLYCRSGNRSGAACGVMAKQGFPQLKNLLGGMGAWKGPIK